MITNSSRKGSCKMLLAIILIAISATDVSSFVLPGPSLQRYQQQQDHWNLIRSKHDVSMSCTSSNDPTDRNSPGVNIAESDASDIARKIAHRSVLPGFLLAAGLAGQVLFSDPQIAQAGFGAGGAAVFSPPQLGSMTEQDFLKLSNSKQLQRASGLVCGDGDKLCERNVDRLLRNLETSEAADRKEIIELKSRIDAMVRRVNERAKQSEVENAQMQSEKQLQELESKVLKATEATLKDLQQKEQLELQLKSRQEFLDRLAAQPPWVSYFAAASGSVLSTLVMHPIDTLKTRRMAGKEDNSGSNPDDPNSSDGNINGSGGNGSGPDSAPKTPSLQSQLIQQSQSGDEMNSFVATSFGMLSNSTDSDDATWRSAPYPSSSVLSSPPTSSTGSSAPSSSFATAVTTRDSDSDTSAVFNFISLYQGLLPNVLKEAPASALYLGVYEAVRGQLTGVPALSQFPLLVYLLSGAVGEVFGSIVRAPAEAVKTKVQTSNLPINDALKASLVGDGLKNTIRAWSSSLFRDVPFGGIQLAVFEGIKSFIISSPSIDFDVSSLFGEAAVGFIAGGCAAFITTPMDRITTLILSSVEESQEPKYDEVTGALIEKPPPPSPLQALGTIYKEEGVAGLLKGAKERTFYWAPAMAIFLSAYCKTRQLFADHLGV